MNSLRQLAHKLDLSHATVSAALSGKPGVKAATRARVVEAAASLGYRSNPLASALMGELRRSRGGVFRGVVALLAPPPGPHGCPHHLALEKGARDRAAQAGFEITLVRVDARDPEPGRLGVILHTRGIRGVLTLPGLDAGRLNELDWSRFSGVHAGVGGGATGLHVVAPDPQAAMCGAFAHLRRLGYQRPGFVASSGRASALLGAYLAAYMSCLLADSTHEDQPAFPAARPFIAEPGQTPPPDVFSRWLHGGDHDAVIAEDSVALGWMRSAGAITPETHGFCLLERGDEDGPCAGMDTQPECVGAHAFDLLREQLLRHETGRPATPLLTLVPPRWIDGDTLREQAPVALLPAMRDRARERIGGA